MTFKALCWINSVALNSGNNLSLLLSRAGLPNIQQRGDHRIREFFLINKILKGDNDSIIIDRLDIGKYNFGYIIDNPYIFSKVPSNFEIAFDSAIDRLLNLSHRFIFIFWSGGIDSTAVLVGIMKKCDHSKITIICDNRSQKENPEFYKKYIEGKIETVTIDQYFGMEIHEDLVLTGVGGDAVFGDVVPAAFNGKIAPLKLLPLDWREDNPWNLEDDNLEIIEKFCSESDIKIKSIQQLRCWFFQRLSLQGRCFEHDWWFDNQKNSKVIHFYNFAEEVARWVLANPDQIIHKEINSYKWPLKNYIYQYDKDRSYLIHKKKLCSGGVGVRAYHRNFMAVPFVMDQDRKWHFLPSSPVRNHAEFLEWNRQHRWLPI